MTKKIHFLLLIMPFFMKANNMTKETWNPEKYVSNSKPQYIDALENIKSISLTGSEHILDIGSGDGKVSAHLAQLVPEGTVLGIDQSEKMVDFAQEKFGSHNISFACIDALKMNFENQFELVTSFFTIHWIQDHQTLIKNIASALKPGGKFLFILNTKEDQPIFHALVQTKAREPWATHLKNFKAPWHLTDAKTFAQILSSSGLHVEKTMKHDNSVILQNRKALEAHLLALPIAQEFIPEDLYSQFIKEMVTNYLNIVPSNENQSVNFTRERTVFIGTKI